jgi:IS30 family transposase
LKGKEQRRLAVQELHLCGYTYGAIAQRLGISKSTVQRTIEKIRKSSSRWLENLAEKDLANIYREGLEGLRQDLMRLNELLEHPSVKDKPELQLQIIKQMTVVRAKYNTQLVSTPVAWSLELCYKKYKPDSLPQPPLKSLGGITGLIN